MRSLRHVLLSTAILATLAGTAGIASAAPRTTDPYTDGARSVHDQRSPFSDGARTVHEQRDPFTQGG